MAGLKACHLFVLFSVTADRIYFSNVPEDCRVVLVDHAGRSILVKEASGLSGGQSLKPYANGLYMIRVMQGQEYIPMLMQ